MTKKSLFAAVLVCFSALSLFAQDIDHAHFHRLLYENIDGMGVPNYTQLRGNVKELDNYIAYLSDFTPNKKWAIEETKAFWINAYNALVLRGVLENLPNENVLSYDNGQFFKTKRFKNRLSLDDIEHQKLRPLNDPRIHFAISCLTESSPILSNFAFEARNMDNRLDFCTRQYIRKHTSFDKQYNKWVVSKVFDWYAADFGDRVGFLNQYAGEKIPVNAEFSFSDYSWQVNGLSLKKNLDRQQAQTDNRLGNFKEN
jgi:Protein of unknown function, DUF547